jgi:hypothetical protein
MTSASTDRDLSARFLATSPATTIAELLNALPKDRAERQAYYLVYPAGDGYVALRWCDVETLASQTLGPAGGVFDKSKPLSDLPGLPTAPNATVNPTSLSSVDLNNPVVIAVGGNVVSVLVDDRWATPGPQRDPFVRLGGGVLGGGVLGQGQAGALPPTATPPAVDVEREVNAWVDDYDGKQPMGVGNVYQLMFDVSPTRVTQTLVPPESAIKVAELFPEGVDRIELSITVTSDDFTIWGSDNLKLIVPRGGDSKGVACFNIEPKHEGECRIDAFIFMGDNQLQQWTFTFRAGPFQAGKNIVQVEGKGIAMSSAGKMNWQRSANAVNIMINAVNQGYSSLLLNGVRTSARLSLTPTAVDQLLARARTALRTIVYTDQFGAAPYSNLQTIDVPPALHQATLNTLAEVGSLLYNELFYSSDDANAASMGDLLRELGQKQSLRIQISGENFVFPWTFLYDRDLAGDAVLDGFWGFRHTIEYVPTAPATIVNFDPEISVSGKLPMLFVSNNTIDAQMGVPLIEGQKAFFGTLADQIDLTTRSSKAELLADLNNADLPAQIVYLYCHAESRLPGEGVGTDSSMLLIDDLVDTNGLTVEQMKIRANFRTKLKSAPLVYLNACQGAEMSALLYGGLVPYLIQKGARGVIGTEVDTPAFFAAEFAKRFFQRFLTEEIPLGQLMLELRREFAEKHNNVMGLVYSLYSNGSVCVVRQ